MSSLNALTIAVLFAWLLAMLLGLWWFFARPVKPREIDSALETLRREQAAHDAFMRKVRGME